MKAVAGPAEKQAPLLAGFNNTHSEGRSKAHGAPMRGMCPTEILLKTSRTYFVGGLGRPAQAETSLRGA